MSRCSCRWMDYSYSFQVQHLTLGMLIVGQKTINLTKTFCASSDWANLYRAATARPHHSQLVRWGEIQELYQLYQWTAKTVWSGEPRRVVCFTFLSLENLNYHLVTGKMESNGMILRHGMHGPASPGVSYICKSQCQHLLLLVEMFRGAEQNTE